MDAALGRYWRFPGSDPWRTAALVDEVARLYGGKPLMRAITVRILDEAGAPPRDDEAAARAIHAWVRDRVRFVLEAGEQVLTPARVLLWGFGDCDDRSGLVAALLHAIRIPFRLVLLCRRSGTPYHIWPQALVGGRWVHLETSSPRARFDQHPRDLAREEGPQL